MTHLSVLRNYMAPAKKQLEEYEKVEKDEYIIYQIAKSYSKKFKSGQI